MPTVDGGSGCRRGQPFGARVRIIPRHIATLRQPFALPCALLLHPLARQSRLLLQCLEKGSVRNKGQSAFSGGVFSPEKDALLAVSVKGGEFK